MAICGQLLQLDEPLEGLLDELLALLEVIEDLSLEREEAPVDPEVGAPDVADVADEGVVGERDGMEALAGTDAEEAGDLALLAEVLEILRQRKIGEPVAVVGEEGRVVSEIAPHRLEALADVGVQTGVGERDLPLVDVPAVERDVLAPARKLEVVRQALVVIEEVLLDEVTSVAEAQDELGVAEMRIVLHQMPQDGPVADRRHGFRDRLRVFAESSAEAPTEEHDLHRSVPSSRCARASRT